MDVKTVIAVLLNAAFANNLLLHRFFAVEGAFEKKTCLADTVKNWAHVSAVLAVSALACWALYTFALAGAGLGYFAELAFVLVIFLVSLGCKKLFRLGGDAHMAVFVSAAAELVCLSLIVRDGCDLAQLALTVVGLCVGFLLALLIFDGLRTRIKMAYVPKAFRNVTVYLLALELMSLAALAF